MLIWKRGEVVEQLGQLIMTGIEGPVLKERERDFIKNCGIGGILLFSRNFHHPKGLAELVTSIQELRREYPLFIAVDQEGGRVIRFKEYFSQFPSMRAIARLNSLELCFRSFEIMAKELKVCGININLSPVCDLVEENLDTVIGDRSFGETPLSVSQFVASAVKGMKSRGILGCAKHFPGHGSVLEDSHKELPIVKKGLDSLIREDLLPFRAAVDTRVSLIMMAHLLIPSLDDKFPTSLSSNAYALLRSELKFEGPIITDDMQMGAVTQSFGVGEAALKAVTAGADIIEYRDMDKAREAYFFLKDALESRQVDEGLLREKIQRILDIKKRELSHYSPPCLEDISVIIGAQEHQDFLSLLREQILQLKS